MNKLKQLRDKLAIDYKIYRESALSTDKETLFNNSYYNAICSEWNCYLEDWFGDDNDSYFGGDVIGILLRLDNIYEDLVDHVGNYNTVGFDQDSFGDYLEEFIEAKKQGTIALCVSKEDDTGIREFEFIISRDYLVEYLNPEQTVDELPEEYTSEDSIEIYAQAILDGKLIGVSGDCWFDEEEESDE